ncbi:uncharacterized protein LOC115588168 [Scomber scombrus]|uniref:Uncharacterized protein LOC115588168 n=1 Tax=Scomber scombrus TaxID=13677 RepID=A0AAV1Q4M7_SCOSC
MWKYDEDPLDYRERHGEGPLASGVRIELPPPFSGKDKQRFPCWARQYEVAVKALVGGTGGDYDYELPSLWSSSAGDLLYTGPSSCLSSGKCAGRVDDAEARGLKSALPPAFKYTLKSREKTAVQFFRREDVKFGEVDRTLCKNINSAAATYKSQQKMNQKEKQQQQSKYGPQVTG